VVDVDVDVRDYFRIRAAAFTAFIILAAPALARSGAETVFVVFARTG
jgi:hypothetical protein